MTTRLLIEELKTSHKEFFESKLALFLIKNPILLPSVKKISNFICLFLNENLEGVLKIIRSTPAIFEELNDERFFGRIQIRQEQCFATAILNAMLRVLTEHTHLSQVMQVHAVFVYRIYEKLRDGRKGNFKENMKDLLAPENRGRIEKKSKGVPTSQLGITRNAVLTKQLKEEGERHIRALDTFIINSTSALHATVKTHAIPFVAGYSGHTSSLLQGMILYNQLNLEEYSEYALACFAFLAVGGNHSYHEVMSVAKKFGVPYEINNYRNLLTDTMLACSEVQELFKLLQEPLRSTGRIVCESKRVSANESNYVNILSRINFIKNIKQNLSAFFHEEQRPLSLVFGYV